ncbi:TPA: hypothetical protein DCR79_00045, partial [Patescibacteria group bacterium]|nr:hypothetical protein [Patescibacteria group bacterium]
IVAIIAAIVLIQRQTKTEEPLLEEIRQAKEQTKEREADLAALDEKYPYWIPGYGPAKFLRAKSDPCFHPCAGRLLYLYQTKSGMDIQIFTPPEMLARKGYEV